LDYGIRGCPAVVGWIITQNRPRRYHRLTYSNRLAGMEQETAPASRVRPGRSEDTAWRPVMLPANGMSLFWHRLRLFPREKSAGRW
jgi:hypothetical protein